jgi:thiol-disulfide isomerase/thioredoxin
MSWFDWKNVLIALAVLAVVVVVVLIVLGKYPHLFPGLKQGFQSGGPPPSVPTFTMFYADWCGHCKKAKPDFVEFMGDGTKTIGDKTVKIEMVNADSGDPKVEAFQVKGYPTFCLQTTDGKVTEYKGKREVAGYLEFLNSSLGGGV